MIVFSFMPVSAVNTEVVPTSSTILVAPCNAGKRDDIPHDTDYCLGPSSGPPNAVMDVTMNISQQNKYTELGQCVPQLDSTPRLSLNAALYCSVTEDVPHIGKAPPANLGNLFLSEGSTPLHFFTKKYKL